MGANRRVPAGICVSAMTVSVDRLDAEDRSDGLQAHRLAQHRLAIAQLGDRVVPARETFVAKDLVGLLRPAPLDLGVTGKQPQRPRHRVRGRVLAGEQQRVYVAENFCVRERFVLFLGGDHALEEVLRLLAQLWSSGHPCARLRYERVDLSPDREHRTVGGAVDRESQPAPVGDRDRDPPARYVEDPLDVALQLAVAVFERVQVVPERERGGHIDRERGQVAADLTAPTLAHRPLEPPAKALGTRAHDLVVALEVVRVQRGDREAALLAPLRALGGEHTDRADQFPRHALDPARTPEPVRTLAQRPIDRIRVCDHDEATAPELERIDRPVAFTPILEYLMKRGYTHAVRDADQRQPSRPGKITNRARSSSRAHRRKPTT